MPKLLITNNQLRSFGGSEMVTLELVEEFLDQGWDVDVYTNYLGKPFSDEFLPALSTGRCRVSDAEDFGTDRSYDLVWIHHSTIPHALLQGEGARSFPPTIWNHMSSFVELEQPILADIECRAASISTFVSPEARDNLIPFGLIRDRTALLQNPVPQTFMRPQRDMTSTKLQRLLLVSNHPPSEVLEAATALKHNGVEIRRIGEEAPERVEASTFDGIDAVLSIGKTVQYSLCLGKPVYIYDHFGGSGWLNESTFDAELQSNFSGRASLRKVAAATIRDEILTGFMDAASFAAKNLVIHQEQFSLRNTLSALVDSATSIGPSQLSAADSHRWRAFSAMTRNMYRSVTGANDTVDYLTTKLGLSEQARRDLETQLEEGAQNLSTLTKEIEELITSRPYKTGSALLKPFKGLRRAP